MRISHLVPSLAGANDVHVRRKRAIFQAGSPASVAKLALKHPGRPLQLVTPHQLRHSNRQEFKRQPRPCEFELNFVRRQREMKRNGTGLRPAG